MNPERYFRPEVLNVKGYHLDKRACQIKLDQNENPFGFPDFLKEKFFARVKTLDWARYPDFQMESLNQKIARFTDLPADKVLVGNGSNSLIQAVLVATLSPGDQIIVSEPTFTLYGLTGKILGAEVISCLLHPEGFSLPMEEILLASRSPRAKVLVLCTPNNPTGNNFPLGDIRVLLQQFPGLVMIDEAYHEFSRQDAKPLLREFENLVILRTFSKAMAMAALRVGYLMAAPEICAQVRKVRLPYSVNLFSELAAELVLEETDQLYRFVREIIQQRDELAPRLRAFSFLRVYPSDANFFLVRAQNGPALFQWLLRAGILARDVSGYPGLENCLRFSVGTAEQNRKLLESLERFSVAR
ncbi:MAG: histidinol-phosphate transaminase [bacterium]